VLEGAFLSMRRHGARLGLTPTRILATGGASIDPAVQRVLCDVMGCPLDVAERSDSASLGAAYRAAHGLRCLREGRFTPFAETVAAAPPFRRVAEPDAAAHAVYTAMLDRYAECERHVMAG
jgi:xylulokinase